MTAYIHTINGKPAHFRRDKGHIVFWRASRRTCPSSGDLAAMREQQQVTEVWREKQGFLSYAEYEIEPAYLPNL